MTLPDARRTLPALDRLPSRITRAEAATVVNNNASAIMLILTALAKGRKVAISRGQLVKIGTTNRTHLRDYEAAILEDGVKVVMRAHHSNYRIIGFTTEPNLADIATLAHQHDVPMIDDIGSGALIDPAQFGLGHEPLIQDSIADGVDLVAFSGDKLLGGPQSGIIVGKKALVNRLKKHPLMRAIRPDKLCPAGLEATLLHYLKDEALTEILIWRMISRPLPDIRAHAERIVTALHAPRTLLDPANDRLLAGLTAALAKPRTP